MDIKGKDFFQDEKFILWRLTDDKELEGYWQTFLKNNPSLSADMEEAIRQFSKIQINKEALTDLEYARLRNCIQTSVAQTKKRRIYRFIAYATAACVACILVFSLFYNQFQPDTTFLAQNIIVGENLDEEDICLITDSTSTSFSNDIHVQVDKSGKTTVKESEGTKSTVLEGGKTAMNKLVVPYGKRSQLELSDGTKVWVNSGSVLEFPSVFTNDMRSINLIGEMYIEVMPDSKKPFYVNTSDFRVKVHGTKFNISAYHDNGVQSVVLVEGSVSVKTQSKEEAFLAPNEMLTYLNNQWDRKTVDVTQYVSWKDGYVLLDHTPINIVLQWMERYYNLSFKINSDVNLTTKTCTGKIYLSDDLDDVMKTVSLLSSTKYTRQEKTIYIQY
ncbi:MAG: FecR family protein [Tannerellaceae bacterium]|jgi:ferric-dicitrate binding protein FerR (iron transport regulator)|nr:FecR family protein [Tannerellaceae bacterium]